VLDRFTEGFATADFHEEQESVSRALAEFFLPAPEGQGLRDKA
jgi:hypothetical protein